MGGLRIENNGQGFVERQNEEDRFLNGRVEKVIFEEGEGKVFLSGNSPEPIVENGEVVRA